MNEWKRILSTRKRALAFLLIPLICIGLFFYDKSGGNLAHLKTQAEEYRALLEYYYGWTPTAIAEDLGNAWELQSIPKRLQKDAAYLTSYGEYLENVQTQAKQMQASSIFNNNPNSFTYRNILKTADDFAGLTAEGLALGNNRAIQDWISFSLNDWAYLVLTMLLILSFLDDRKRGLSAIIRACPGGREKLQLSRMGILFLFCIGMTVVLYYVPLAISFVIDGGIDCLSRPVQCMEAFRTCTLHITLREFLTAFFCVKVICGFFLGILMWFLLSFLSHVQLSLSVTCAVLGVEYLTYILIPVQSWLSPLGQINVFSFVFATEIFTQYRNINLFSFPVQRRTVLLAVLAVTVIVLGMATIRLLTRRYPYGNRDYLGKYMDIWNRVGDRLRRNLGLYGMECYKLLFLTAAGIFLLLGLVLTKNIEVDSGWYNDVSRMAYRQYLAEVEGPITEDTYAYVADAKAALEKVDSDVSTLYNALCGLEETLSKKDEGDWLVDEDTFRNVYGEKAYLLQRKNAMIAMLVLTACLSPLFACDQSGDLKKILRAAPEGRKKLFRTKYTAALTMTILVWGMVFGREWIAAIRCLGTTIPKAPCHSVELVSHLPGTVGSFMAALYCGKLLVLLIPMHLCILFSEVCPTFETAFLFGGVVLLLPGAAYTLGVNSFGVFSPVSFLAGGNLLISSGMIIPIIIWSTVSVAASLAAQNHWCRVK